jgi:predicted nucleic acid-binding protein
MRLTEIPRGSLVFIDANVFIYHFAGRSDDCSALLTRVESGDLQGATGDTVLLEVGHRLMIVEAIEQGLRPGANPAARLAKQPGRVQHPSKYFFSLQKIPQMGVEILSLPRDFLSRTQEFRQAHGLLVNDSLVPLYMREAGARYLASSDAAFDRIPWVRRAAPHDL